ncbi:MAG: bile acid:sodium symporter family protein [Gammaproteobacteria bacterium]|nr:bile acid:sodium symporter family protein [Gammaproteobacteria bacterium]MDH5311782.1 bile acid:sodium symporter family protein [Gammaproteobacteria bacterium]
MSSSQLLLNAVLFAMIYAVALELQVSDFLNVAKRPLPVAAGLAAQFLLLPVATFAATLVLTLPANIEAGMLLVAACPCGSLSNFVTHYARGNTALSLSVTAVANVLALVLTPTNFAWMMAANPATAAWLREIELDPALIWLNLAFVLALPLALGLMTRAVSPAVSERVRKPLGRLAVAALLAFVVVALVRDRDLLSLAIAGLFAIVVLHNGIGLLLGYGTAVLAGLTELDRRALTFETGMQNSGLALAIVGTRFDADVGMVIVAGLWGTWHIVSGFALAHYWRGRSDECLIPG